MMPGMHREIACQLLAKPAIAPAETVMQAATYFVLSTVCPGINIQHPPTLPSAGHITSSPEAAINHPETPEPASRKNKRGRACITELVPNEAEAVAQPGIRPRSKRLADREGPLFVDVIAQATYLKAKKMGDAPSPPLSLKQLQVLGEGCNLEKKKLKQIKEAAVAASVPPGTE